MEEIQGEEKVYAIRNALSIIDKSTAGYRSRCKQIILSPRSARYIRNCPLFRESHKYYELSQTVTFAEFTVRSADVNRYQHQVIKMVLNCKLSICIKNYV